MVAVVKLCQRSKLLVSRCKLSEFGPPRALRDKQMEQFKLIFFGVFAIILLLQTQIHPDDRFNKDAVAQYLVVYVCFGPVGVFIVTFKGRRRNILSRQVNRPVR